MKTKGMKPITVDKTIYVNIWWWEGESIVMRGYTTRKQAVEDEGKVSNLYFDETIYPFDEDEEPYKDIDVLKKILYYLEQFCEGANYEVVGLQKLR